MSDLVAQSSVIRLLQGRTAELDELVSGLDSHVSAELEGVFPVSAAAVHGFHCPDFHIVVLSPLFLVLFAAIASRFEALMEDIRMADAKAQQKLDELEHRLHRRLASTHHEASASAAYWVWPFGVLLVLAAGAAVLVQREFKRLRKRIL